MAQQPFLAVNASAITCHRTIAANHAVARNDDGNGVAAVGRANCAAHIDVAQLAGDVAVGYCGAARDLAQFGPDRFLKTCAASIGEDVINGMNVAAIIVSDDIGQTKWICGRLQFEILEAQFHFALNSPSCIFKLKQQQHTILRDKDHIADGRWDAVSEEAVHGRDDTSIVIPTKPHFVLYRFAGVGRDHLSPSDNSPSELVERND